MNKKKCNKCGSTLPLECFSKNKSKKDGLCAWCKECNKQYLKQWRADNADYFKQWRAENLDKIKQYNAERYATLEMYAYNVRKNNLLEDRKYSRCRKDEDQLPSLDYYMWALQQPDFYDGKKYHWSEMGLDRIYNDKPHTFANVVPCSTANNRRRGKKSFEEFCKLMRNENEELTLAYS